MTPIQGTFKDGQIVLDGPADWPEGCRVLVEPLSQTATSGLRDEDWPDTPEGIARHLALMDQFQPLEITPEEEAQWQAARKAQKDYEIAKFDERAERIERLFP